MAKPPVLAHCDSECGSHPLRVNRRHAVRKLGGWFIFSGLASMATASGCGRTPLGDPLGSDIGPGGDDDDDAITTITTTTPPPSPTPTPEPCSCTLQGASSGLTTSSIAENQFAFQPALNLFICHDALGFYCMSDVCPHAGEHIGSAQAGNWNPLNLAGGFRCFKHGSTFDGNGLRTGGPAPVGSNMTHYRLSIESGTNALWYDLAVIVEPDCRCTGPV